jgi:hypothetical protein
MSAKRAMRSTRTLLSPSGKFIEISVSGIETLSRRCDFEAMLTLRARLYKF